MIIILNFKNGAGAKEDDYLVDEELNAVIVEESRKGEKEREEEELAEATARQNMASIRWVIRIPAPQREKERGGLMSRGISYPNTASQVGCSGCHTGRRRERS
jgi:hypothetical protein